MLRRTYSIKWNKDKASIDGGEIESNQDQNAHQNNDIVLEIVFAPNKFSLILFSLILGFFSLTL